MTKIIQRHDTAVNWASVNPVLAQGEMGIEDDTRKFKFGDGTTAWADLAYASSAGGGGEGGTSDYNELTNKPRINNVELSGNNTSTDLGLQDVFSTENPINIRVETISSTKNIAIDKDANAVTASSAQSFNINSNNIFSVYASSTNLSKKGVIFPNYIALPIDANTIYVNNTNNIFLGYYLDDGSFYPKFIFGSGYDSLDDAFICASITNSGNYKNIQVARLTLSSAIRNSTLTRAIRVDKANNTIYLSNSKSGNTKPCVITAESYINELQKCTTVMLVSSQSNLDYGLKNANSYWMGALKYDNTEFKIPTESEAVSLVKRYPDDAIVTRYLNLKVDNSTVKVNSSGALEAIPQEVNVATVDTVGTVKPDGTSITVTEDGTISAVAPANMITSDNIASDTTIIGMNNAIEMAQGNITTLSATVESNSTKIVSISQTDYDALTDKDANTLYIITE